MNEQAATTVNTQKRFFSDFSASLVVFLVALPLCMGVAFASGAPPLYGLIAGVIGGMLVGHFTGSPLQVSGPTPTLTVIVWELIQKFGIEVLGLAVLVAGIMQFACGQMKLGQWFRAVSPSVIHGILTGIGLLIFSSQFHLMVDDNAKGTGFDNLISIPEAIWKGLVPTPDTTHHLAAQVGVITILIIVLWQSFAPKKLKFLPAPLIAIVAVTLYANLLEFPIQYVSIPENFFAAIPWPPSFFEHAHLLANSELWIDIAGIAFIASAETLLTTSAVDKMQTYTKANYDKELSAQGIGNMTCGVLGVLPIAGVIVRSAANIQAGAVTNRATMMHGLWLLLSAIVAVNVLNTIPTAALAAILVFTGYKLMNFKVVPELRKHGRGEVIIFFATFVAIMMSDLLTGIFVGLLLAFAKLIYVFSYLSINMIRDDENDCTHMYLRGAATFIRLPQLAQSFEELPGGVNIIVHVDQLSYIDHACMELFRTWESEHRPDGGTILIDWDAASGEMKKKVASLLPSKQ